MGCGTIDSSNKNSLENNYKNNQPFYLDKSFPPSNISIFGKDNLEKINLGKKIPHNKYYKGLLKDFKQNQIIWKRAKDIFNNQEYSLFSRNISHKSIIQGSIGNCYFLTMLSSLTKYPSLIYQLFNILNISGNGYYKIYLKINDEISINYVDDYFPYNIRKNKPVFCKSYNNEIWVMLLEKAWAKIKGSYFKIDNGSPIDILNAFLLSSNIKDDISYKFYSLNNEKNKNELWKILTNKINSKNIFMICLSKGNLKNQKKLSDIYYTIVEKHFYNINEIYEKDGKCVIKLRNPWGFNKKNKNYRKKETQVDFILDSSEENVEEDDDSSIDNGEFLIDYNYFCYLFDEVQIYEIKKFSINLFYNLKDEKDKIIIIKLGTEETKKNMITIQL